MSVLTEAPSTASESKNEEATPSFRKAALHIVDGRVFMVIDGGDQKQLLADTTPVEAEVLGKTLDELPGENWQIFIVGTRADGTAGWDEVEASELIDAIPYPLVFLTEGQALHAAGVGDGKPSGYLILAEKPGITPTNTLGSARWWVAGDDGVLLANFIYLGNNYGQLYTLAGGGLASTPSIISSIAADFAKAHPEVRRIFIWSQTGMQDAPYKPDGEFWKGFHPPLAFDEAGGHVKILTDPAAVLKLLTAPAE